jgi:TonB family protein
MKLLTGKRVGQSGGELTAAILFSSIFHVIVFSAALLLAVQGPLRKVAPPSYRVKLVDLPPDIAKLPPTMAEPAGLPAAPAPKPPQPKAKAPSKAAPRAAAPRPSAVSKDAMPELDAKKDGKKAAEEPSVARSGETAKKQESVAVASTTGGFTFPPYLVIVRDKVERNWNPPPGAKGAKVKVTFRVLRSGRVGEAKLMESSGNFYFDQAAMRAILASSPFPPLPEGFFQEYETFSVDLMEKE